ncbi:hypothetical protein IM538_13835 [Cytobacillus suaedae]|nr:hypothetical protein IM538_13835 [Cytobacillus suaedae]
MFGEKLNIKEQLFACFVLFFITTIIAIITPWNQYKMYFMGPVIVFSAFIGILVSRYFFKNN